MTSRQNEQCANQKITGWLSVPSSPTVRMSTVQKNKQRSRKGKMGRATGRSWMGLRKNKEEAKKQHARLRVECTKKNETQLTKEKDNGKNSGKDNGENRKDNGRTQHNGEDEDNGTEEDKSNDDGKHGGEKRSRRDRRRGSDDEREKRD